jgi:DNA invertase Pin-like site-specific DNA recombinase
MNHAKAITVISLTINIFTASPIRRVAGYARVSTDSDEQQTSYDAQVDYYTNYINSRNDWQFVFCYTDEGISATSTAKREGFKQMVADALDGKIDLIVTKSVSRFARNTVDSLTTIRKLKENGTEVFFEKEGIWTFDGKGELLITIMSSLAQEESRSISENVTWGHRKRFSDGKVSVPYSRFLGFDKGDEDGVLKINEQQAVLVRRIYRMFLDGLTPHAIAKQLTAEGIPSTSGKDRWYSESIKNILKNEKYRGDALLQKQFTVDFLSKKRKKNEGEIQQFYVENAHPYIIEPAVFEMVQEELKRRKPGVNRHSGVGLFAGKIKCGTCSSWFGAKIWHSTSKYRRTIYQCNGKFRNSKKCGTPHLGEENIKRLFVSAVNKLLSDKDGIIEDFELIKQKLFDTTELEAERVALQSEMAVVAELLQKYIEENARVALDQSEYQQRYNGLADREERAKERLTEVSGLITSKRSRSELIEQFMSELANQDMITEFNERLWHNLLDYATVYSEDDVRFTFKNGSEVMA